MGEANGAAVREGCDVAYDVRDGVAVVTLDRPEARNAFTPSMHREYRSALARAERDPSVRAIVVTGAGKAFCAGADTAAVARTAEAGRYLATAPEVDDRPGYGVHPDFDRPFAYHFGLTKPVVAAVNGVAVGLGTVLACYADIRFAATGAELRLGFAPLGLPAEYGLSWLLPRLIGVSRAADLLLTSRPLPAEEAHAAGLVARVCDPDRLVEEAVAFGAELGRRCSPAAVRETKRQLYTDLLRDLGTSFDEAMALVARMVDEPDFREGVAALRERRPPRFPSADGPPTTSP